MTKFLKTQWLGFFVVVFCGVWHDGWEEHWPLFQLTGHELPLRHILFTIKGRLTGGQFSCESPSEGSLWSSADSALLK